MTKPKAQVKAQPQRSMDETQIVENEQLEALLDKRQDLKESVREHTKLTKEAKTIIAGIEIPTPYRVGRYVISKTLTDAKHVEFDTDAGYRVNIKADSDPD